MLVTCLSLLNLCILLNIPRSRLIVYVYIIFYHIIVVCTSVIYIQYIISWLYFLQSCSLIVLAQICVHWGTEKGKKNINWNYSVSLRSFNLVSLCWIIDSCSRSLIKKYTWNCQQRQMVPILRTFILAVSKYTVHRQTIILLVLQIQMYSCII